MSSRSFIITNQDCKMLLPNPFLFELAMEEYIIEHIDVLTLSEDYISPQLEGYEVAKKKKRYDIVVRYDSADTIAIVEIKKGKLDQKAYNQLLTYMAIDAKSPNPLIADNKIGVLVGTEIDSALIPIVMASPNIYAVVLNRYDSGKDETIHTTIFTPSTAPQRDYTRYTLKTKLGKMLSNLGKSRLVLEIIRAYIEETNCTLTNLQKQFPKKLANRGKGSKMPIIREQALTPADALYVRYFKEPLYCENKPIYVCNQWGKGNIQQMINKAQNDLGMTITIQK